MNKIVLITGATSGIGEASALKFAAGGWDLIITGRRKDKLESLASSIRSAYRVEVLSLAFDVQVSAEVDRGLDSLKGRWTAVDVLVNNAGLALGAEPFHLADTRDWDVMIDTNVKGLLYVSRKIVSHMIRNGRGHIINVASTAGHIVYPGGHVYCATKHAVLALSQGMRLDLVSQNIKVSSVSPGATETEFSIVRYKGDKDKADEKYRGFAPLSGDDVAASIYFIATQPDHVNIEEIVLQPKAQASPFVFHKDVPGTR